MAQRRIIWSHKAEIELEQILDYFFKRNKSNVYSKRLYKTFKSQLEIVMQSPYIGLKTNFKNIRGLIIDEYMIFYKIGTNEIVVLKIWDCRQNPENLIY